MKRDKVPVAETVQTFGFKSRSSYYLFAMLIREQGFVGLFDMRPVNRKISQARPVTDHALTGVHSRTGSARPEAAIWKLPCGPWRNAFYGLQYEHRSTFVQIVRAFAEGNGVRGIGRIFTVDKNTVLEYLQRAAIQCRRITDLLLRGLHVKELQLDEMWSFVQKKEKNLTEEEYLSQMKGDQWCWVAKDVQTKVMVQYEIGRRTYALARDLIQHFRERTEGTIPSLVTSDEYGGYEPALLDVYGVWSNGRKVPPSDMDYAVVSKTREKGRVVAIEVKVIFGSLERIQKKLEKSPVSNNVNVAFVERSHLARRQFNRRLSRKTLGFSKKLPNHLWQYELETAIHNFVRPHRGLQNRTPMMAAGKTDHPWSVKELLSYNE